MTTIGTGTIGSGLGTHAMLFRTAVRKIKPHHIQPGLDHLIQHLGIIGGGAECGDNFGSTLHGYSGE